LSESKSFSNKDANGVEININESEAYKVYKFAADNFSVEFGMVTGAKDGNSTSIVYTTSSTEMVNAARAVGPLISSGYYVLETHHSHPGKYGEPAGFWADGTPKQPLTGDASAASAISKYNKGYVYHYVYHPKSGKTYQYDQYGYNEVE
jgi:hypothetical protein